MAAVRSPDDHYPPSDKGESKIFGLLSTPSVDRISKDGRKAKRALRRRIKPKQQRCSERMRGPVIEEPSWGVPKLPLGGDGLALVSLRPSLGPRGRRVTVDHSSPPRRPSTASGLPYHASRPQLGGPAYAGGHRSVQPRSAPPEAVSSSRKTGLGDDNIQRQNDGGRKEQELQESLQHPQIYPLRPVGEKERARQPYTDAGQRTIRNKEMLRPFDEGNLRIVNDDCHGEKVPWEEARLEPDTPTPRPMVEAESSELFGPLYSTQQGQVEGDEDALSQPMGEEEAERSATVVLASNVLLSPRGRAKTPTLLVGDGSHFSPWASDCRDASPDSLDDRVYNRSATSHTAQGISDIGQPTSRRAREVYSPNAPQDHLWMPPDAEFRQHVVTKVPMDRIISRVTSPVHFLYDSMRKNIQNACGDRYRHWYHATNDRT